MEEVEKVIVELDRLKSAIRMEDSGRGKINVMPCISTIDEAIQTIRELQSNQCHLNSPCEYQNEDIEVEEVCEWEEYVPMDKYFHRYYLGCREAFIQFHIKTSYKYCPYCGKKIKVVK